MEVCVPSNTSACQDISSSSESSAGLSSLTNYSSGNLCMNDLGTRLTEILSSEGIQISTASGDNNKCNVVRKDECKDSDEKRSNNSASEKCFNNCVTSHALGEHISSVDGLLDGEKGKEDSNTSELNSCVKSIDQCHSQPLPLPAPLKPVSAMKGSREKQGISPKKRSVTWAPDVYDPIPTSVSHVPSSKNQRYRNDGKKYGKNKQKGGGKSSRGSKGKDKKQTRKNGSGSGTTKLKSLYDESSVGIREPEAGIVDYNVVSPDPFCGSSFLKESVTNLHIPVTEATR